MAELGAIPAEEFTVHCGTESAITGAAVICGASWNTAPQVPQNLANVGMTELQLVHVFVAWNTTAGPFCFASICAFFGSPLFSSSFWTTGAWDSTGGVGEGVTRLERSTGLRAKHTVHRSIPNPFLFVQFLQIHSCAFD